MKDSIHMRPTGHGHQVQAEKNGEIRQVSDENRSKLCRKETLREAGEPPPDAAATVSRKKAVKKKMVYDEAKRQEKERIKLERERLEQKDKADHEYTVRRQAGTLPPVSGQTEEKPCPGQERTMHGNDGRTVPDTMEHYGNRSTAHSDESREGKLILQDKSRKKGIYEEHAKQKESRLIFDDDAGPGKHGGASRKPAGPTVLITRRAGDSIRRKAEAEIRNSTDADQDCNSGIQAAYGAAAVSGMAVRTASGIRGIRTSRKERDHYGPTDDKTVQEGKRPDHGNAGFYGEADAEEGTGQDGKAWPGTGRSEKDAAQAESGGGGRLRFESAASGERGKAAESSSKAMQKKRNGRKYAEAYRQRNAAEGKPAAGAWHSAETFYSDVKETAGKAKEYAAGFIKKHKASVAAAAAILMAGIMLGSAFGVFGSILDSSGRTIIQSTYLAPDDEIWEADAYYCSLEEGLQEKIDNIETDHPGFDEYRYELDEITHDGFALTSYLTAKYGNYKADDVKEEMDKLFRWQYDLRYRWEDEKRTRTETRTRLVIDPETGRLVLEEYEVEVEYTWYILVVKLTNYGLDETARRWWLYGKTKRQYGIYMATLGNRPYLFDEARIGNPAGGGPDYEIPPETLSEAVAEEVIREAEKYLGTPYVWGGYSPAGFDCSGFVSYVLEKCGYGIGRLTADGLWNATAHISKSGAKPGDLVFFEGTYNTPGASHVGIYVGNGMMIHCGKPVQYTTIESDYWKRHLLGFGRLP